MITLDRLVGVYVFNACGSFLLIVGVLIFCARNIRAANKAFGFTIFLAGAWTINAGFIARCEASLLFNLRLGATLAAGLVYAMPFIFEAIRNPGPGRRWLTATLRPWFLFSVALAAMPCSGLFTAWDSPRLNPDYGPLWIVQHALMSVAMYCMVVRSWFAAKKLVAIRAREMRCTVAIISAAIGTISASLCFLSKVNPVPRSALGVLIVLYTSAVAWGLLIRGYYAFGTLTRLFIKYIAALAIAFCVYTILGELLPRFTGLQGRWISFLSVTGAVLTGGVLARQFLRKQHAVLYHSIAEFQKQMVRIGNASVDVDNSVRELSSTLAHHVGTAEVFFFKEAEPGRFYLSDEICLDKASVPWSARRESAWVTGEYLLQRRAVLETNFSAWLTRNNITLLVLSSISAQRTNLCVAFGERVDGQDYTFEELDKLALMVDAVALAVASVEAAGLAREAGKAMAIGLMSASILHEVKQPLSALKLFMRLLPANFNDARFRERYFDAIHMEVNRIEQYLSEFLQFGGPTKLNIHAMDPLPYVQETIDLVRFKAVANQVRVTLQTEEYPCAINCDIGVLKQGLLNLLLNAIDGLAAGGSVSRLIVVSIHQNSSTAFITVRDNGPGLPAEIMKRLFRPFVTSKSNGTGLGLFISRDLILRCGGKLEAANRKEGGACFVISFPLAMPVSTSPEMPALASVL